ncbi:hypothetical protein KJ969_00530 [Patescibacteria group bacterium]|nr:hypothetical protein [Patescibacteria group bacterium]MBU1922473.1 hypothetical protein [Patescibacteria group bacterium]
MGKIHLTHTYNYIISYENLLEAWKEFIRGKRSRKDVQEFEFNLMDNIIELHNDLASKRYSHSSYQAFNISDPKPRHIHKADVRDRLLHHAIYRVLYPLFDKIFVPDSYSCRIDKGTHKAMNRFRDYAFITSENHTRTAWVLKCDIKKFFASINHDILNKIIRAYIPDRDIMWLIAKIIDSFNSGKEGIGLPLGNLTSQLLVNIYMNYFDQWVKHKLKAKYYIRYADDFVILSHSRRWLEDILPLIGDFLRRELYLKLHPDKVFIKTFASGVDFLGWVHFPDHRVLRTATARRVLRNIVDKKSYDKAIQSYLGLLSHGNARGLEGEIYNLIVNHDYQNKHYPIPDTKY